VDGERRAQAVAQRGVACCRQRHELGATVARVVGDLDQTGAAEPVERLVHRLPRHPCAPGQLRRPGALTVDERHDPALCGRDALVAVLQQRRELRRVLGPQVAQQATDEVGLLGEPGRDHLTSGYLTCDGVRVPDTAATVIRRYVDTFGREDVDGLAALYAEVTDYRQPLAPEPLTTPAAVHAFESGMFGAFHDVAVDVGWLLADGDHAAAGLTISATHDESGVRVSLQTAEHLRVDASGKIVEHTRYTDSAAFLAQLGAPATM
jgi:ketosteroid isomerase-like protein